MMIKGVTTFFLALTSVAATAQWTVKSVPNPKAADNTYVSNPDIILSASAVQSINVMLTELEAANTTQVAVVALESIGGNDIFDFSQELFMEWGIGQSDKDNGLLIILVVDQRTVRFHTGEGTEEVLPDYVTKQIQEQEMIPHFANGDYNTGMIAGVEAASKILIDGEYPEEYQAFENENTRSGIYFLSGFTLLIALIVALFKWTARKNSIRRLPHVKITGRRWSMLYLAGPAAIGIGAALSLSTATFLLGLYTILLISYIDRWQRMLQEVTEWNKKQEYRIIHDFLQTEKIYWSILAFVFPVPGIFFAVKIRKQITFFRNHPRSCKECGAPAAKLDDKNEDAFLSRSQLFEEDLKSVDYDVWKCTSCNNLAIETYENSSTKYSHCQKCGTKAYSREKVVTIKSATTSSTGLKEETYHCKFCGNRVIKKVVIPIVVASSSSSSGGGGGSSGGGSFGGGSSGGGGSSSSW